MPIPTSVANALQDETNVVSNEAGAFWVHPKGANITGWRDLSKPLEEIPTLRNCGDYDENLTETISQETFKVDTAHNPGLKWKRVERGYNLAGAFVEQSLENYCMITDSYIETTESGVVIVVPNETATITEWGGIFECIGINGLYSRVWVPCGTFTAEVASDANRTGKRLMPFTYNGQKVAGLKRHYTAAIPKTPVVLPTP